ncbi:MAG: hypothetical protein WAK53_11965 [Chromatiaceae bacterium]
MKAIFAAALLVVSAAAMAGGDTKRQGAPEESWLGVSNTDDTERSLMVKCPAGTSADSVEALPDEEGMVIVVECNYLQ